MLSYTLLIFPYICPYIFLLKSYFCTYVVGLFTFVVDFYIKYCDQIFSHNVGGFTFVGIFTFDCLTMVIGPVGGPCSHLSIGTGDLNI